MDLIPKPRPGIETEALQVLDAARFSLSREDLIRTEIQARQLEFKLLKRKREEKVLQKGGIPKEQIDEMEQRRSVEENLGEHDQEAVLEVLARAAALCNTKVRTLSVKSET